MTWDLIQDPKQRITMARVMKHPWVTKRGQWPLKSVREIIKEHGRFVDSEEPELPDLMSTYNVLDVPRQVQLAACAFKYVLRSLFK